MFEGLCPQFRAVSDQLYQTPKFHSEVRQQVVKQLKSHAQLYADFAGKRSQWLSSSFEGMLIKYDEAMSTVL